MTLVQEDLLGENQTLIRRNIMLLYFDESGNTGSNWLDAQQPYFVYWGWLVKDDKKEIATKLLAECFSDSKATELKSKTIWDRKKDNLINFINRMILEADAFPCFGIADKKYMIAAKIVETFFDFEYNPHVNGYLTGRSELKKALADSLSKNDILIENFAKLIKEGKIGLEQMKLINQGIQEHFEQISPSISQIFNKLSDDSLIKMIGEFESITKNGTEKKWISLVIPILFERISCLDSFCNITSESGKIYVDELKSFDDVFNDLNIVLNNKRIYKNDIQISMCDSKAEPLIQAADLLSGFISRSFVKINKVSSDDKINEIWKSLIDIRDKFCNFETVVWEFYASKDFINLIFELAGLPKNETNNPELIIKDQINKAITKKD